MFILRLTFQANPERLVGHLVEDHSVIDPTYVEDFLLTYKTFLDKPREICGQLLNWFSESALRDKVSKLLVKRDLHFIPVKMKFGFFNLLISVSFAVWV